MGFFKSKLLFAILDISIFFIFPFLVVVLSFFPRFFLSYAHFSFDYQFFLPECHLPHLIEISNFSGEPTASVVMIERATEVCHLNAGTFLTVCMFSHYYP